jgi:hypothetical protein
MRLRVREKAKRRVRLRKSKSRLIPQWDNFTAIYQPFQLRKTRSEAFERNYFTLKGSERVPASWAQSERTLRTIIKTRCPC